MTKRIFAFLLASLFLCISFAACGEEKKNSSDNGEEKIDIVDAYTPDREILDTVVMKIGDVEITYETYRYYYMSCRSSYEAAAVSKTVDEIKKEVLEELIYQSAVQTLAEKHGTGLTENQKQTIETAYKELAQAYADYDSDLASALAMKYMTPEVYKDIYAFETYSVSNLFDYCKDSKNGVLDFSEETISELLSEFYCSQMIYVGITETRNEENALKKVEGILEKLANGEDFVQVATQHSDYSEGDSIEDGFYFRKGDVEDEVEKAYFELAEGEYTTTAVKTDTGFYILRRVANDMEYFSENLYPSYAFNDYLKLTEEELKIVYTDFFDGMFSGKTLVHEKVK